MAAKKQPVRRKPRGGATQKAGAKKSARAATPPVRPRSDKGRAVFVFKNDGGDQEEERDELPTPVAIPEPPQKIPFLESKSERIAFIVQLMASLRWPTRGNPDAYAFKQRVATAWNVSPETVKGYAADAHRLLEVDDSDRDLAMRELGNFCRIIALDAFARKSAMTGLPDYAASISAIKHWAKFMGIDLDQKVKLTHSVEGGIGEFFSKLLAEEGANLTSPASDEADDGAVRHVDHDDSGDNDIEHRDP